VWESKRKKKVRKRHNLGLCTNNKQTNEKERESWVSRLPPVPLFLAPSHACRLGEERKKSIRDARKRETEKEKRVNREREESEKRKRKDREKGGRRKGGQRVEEERVESVK